jgi:excisionase family DNA binding protein
MTDHEAKRPARRAIDRPRAPGSPLTIAQAAAAMNLSERTVRKRIAQGRLVAYRDGRAVRIAEADLADYLAGLRGPGRPAATAGYGPLVPRRLKIPAKG